MEKHAVLIEALIASLVLTRIVEGLNRRADVRLLHPDDPHKLKNANNAFHKVLATESFWSLFGLGIKPSKAGYTSIKSALSPKPALRNFKTLMNTPVSKIVKSATKAIVPITALTATSTGIDYTSGKMFPAKAKVNKAITKAKVNKAKVKDNKAITKAKDNKAKVKDNKFNALGVGVVSGIAGKLLGLSTTNSVLTGLGSAALTGLYNNRKYLKKLLNK